VGPPSGPRRPLVGGGVFNPPESARRGPRRERGRECRCNNRVATAASSFFRIRRTPPLWGAVARGEPLLLAYSEALLPSSREWPANAIVTGWWFLDDGARWSPPSELERFLAEGPAPIYVGFGSMAFRDPAPLRDLVLKPSQGSARVPCLVQAGAGSRVAVCLPQSSRSTRLRTTGCFRAWPRSSITAGSARPAQR